MFSVNLWGLCKGSDMVRNRDKGTIVFEIENKIVQSFGPFTYKQYNCRRMIWHFSRYAEYDKSNID